MKTALRLASAALLAASLAACSSGSGTTANGNPTSASKAPGSASSPSSSSPSSHPTSGAGSGNAGSSQYCNTLQQTKSDLKGMDFTSLSDRQFNDFRDRISTLQSQAPANVQDDWGVLGSTLDTVKQLLSSAGVSFDDLRALRQHQAPSGSVDLARLQQIAPRLQALGNDSSLTTAKNAITKSARAACSISLH